MRGFYHDDGMIKVITGVRRCGKSCLMQSIADELVESGVASDHIIYIDLDSRENRKVKTTDELENLIDMSTPADTEGTKYLFIDEIHRFSKSQQDALLHAVENRTVIMIGATTENPYFEVN